MLKYQIIANEIEHNIYSNNLPQGTKLPTVETLASDYKVSKSTIVKAIEALVSRGIVYQLQGSGIFVRRRNRSGYIDLNITEGFTNSLKEFTVTSKVLEFDLIPANEEIAELIECNINDKVANILNLNPGDPAMVVLEQIYLPSGVLFNASKLVYNYKNTQFFLQSSYEK